MIFNSLLVVNARNYLIMTYVFLKKKIKKLYFAGEILDVDALTGGFNLQIAWSTGYLAGLSIEA